MIKLFDYQFDDSQVMSSTSLFKGQTNGILNTNKLTYKWAYELYKVMVSNTWFVEEVDFTQDNYLTLLPAEKRMYDLIHGQVVFMDSIQPNQVMSFVNGFITDPMIQGVIARLAWEEVNHSVSYSVGIETVTQNTDMIYNLHKTDSILRKKNEFIGGVYEKYGPIAINMEGKYSEQESFDAAIKMLIANQCLEGIYFMSNFAAIYTLGRAGKIPGTTRNFKFINRDEDCHTTLISNIFKEIRKENEDKFSKELIDDCYKMIDDAVNLEIEWAHYITNNEIFGIDNESFTKYIKWLGNDRLRLLGLSKDYGLLYNDCQENNLKWITSFKKLNDTKSDFFQSDVQNYTMGVKIDTSDI